MGIAELTNLFYDSSYMSFIARVTFMKTKWFGAAVEPWLIGGDVHTISTFGYSDCLAL
jgi:hypothetical protein